MPNINIPKFWFLIPLPKELALERNIILILVLKPKRKIPIITQFIPSLFNDTWLKKLSFLFKNYNYFYDLKKNEKKKLFEPQEIIKLHSEYIANNNYTDILIV